MPAQVKPCKKCGISQTLDEFHRHPYTKDGHKATCKSCLRQHYQENREELIKQSGQRQSEWRKRAIDKLGGPRCRECGCDVYDILEINHVNGGGNVDRKENGMVSGKLWRAIALELRDLSEFEVLCRMCNQKHYVETLLGVQGFTVAYSPKTQNFPKKIWRLFKK